MCNGYQFKWLNGWKALTLAHIYILDDILIHTYKDIHSHIHTDMQGRIRKTHITTHTNHLTQSSHLMWTSTEKELKVHTGTEESLAGSYQ